MIRALTITGGKSAKSGRPLNLIFLKRRVNMAAISVASVPKTISSKLKEPIFAIKQPTVRPGIAAGVKMGKMVSTSEKRNCIGP